MTGHRSLAAFASQALLLGLLLLAGGLLAAGSHKPDPVPPRTQTIRPATPDEAKAAELHRQLELCRARLERDQPCAGVSPTGGPR